MGEKATRSEVTLPKKNKMKNRTRKNANTKEKLSKPDEEKLTLEQKKRLCALIKDKPVIWSLLDPLHGKLDFQAVAWTEISSELGVPVKKCKAQWKSLKDSLRLQVKSGRKPGKSGDSADEDGDNDDPSGNETDPTESWPFWDDLKFLDTSKPSNSTLSTSVDAEANLNVEGHGLDDTDVEQVDVETPNVSNYVYMNRKRKKEERATENLLTGINELIKIRKAEVTQTDVIPDGSLLKYHSIYANLDRMLTKLDSDIVEELNYEFISLTRAELRKKPKELFTFQIE